MTYIECYTSSSTSTTTNKLLPVPVADVPRPLDLLLQLQHTVKQRLRSRWTPWHIDINWYDTIATAHHCVRVMVVTATVGTRPHRDNPPWFWHLIVHTTQGGRHFVCECARDNHDVGLSRTRSEYDSEPIHVVAGRREVHHLDGATRQSECHRPQRGATCPIHQIVNLGDRKICGVVDFT